MTPADRRILGRLRLAGQLVIAAGRRDEIRQPGDVVRWMMAMQAQDFLGAKWAVGLRLPGTTDADIESALADGSIVRSWPMRGTLHFVAPEDLGWMLSLSVERMVKRAASTHAAEGLTARVLESAREGAHSALAGGTALDRDAMYRILERAGVSSIGQARYHALWFLSQTGTLCLGPPRGKQQTFVLLDEWVPAPRRLERDEALGELAHRYFRSHGPATIRDFAWWSSLTLADAKAGLAVARPLLAEREIDGIGYFLSPEAEDSPGASGTQLLPGFDEFLLGYQDRDAVLAEEHIPLVFPGKNGIFLSTIVQDGAVAGTWRRTTTPRQVSVQPSPFSPPSARMASGFARTAKAYARFLDLPLREDA